MKKNKIFIDKIPNNNPDENKFKYLITYPFVF